MQVTLMPHARSTSIAWSINIPILGEMHRIHVSGGKDRETYTVELSPEDETLRCADLVKEVKQGRRTRVGFSEKQVIHWQRSDGGGIPAPSYLPFLKIAGFSQDLRVSEVVTDMKSANSTVRATQLTRTRETQRLFDGTRQQHVFATLFQQQEGSNPRWSFLGLRLGFEIQYDRYTTYWQPRLTRKLNREFLNPWQQLEEHPFAYDAAYTLSIQRTLNPEDLATLANAPQWAIDLVAQTTHADADALQTMVHSLAYHAYIPLSTIASQAQANALRSYLGNVGLPGLGAIHLLLGGDLNDWEISVKHGAVANVALHATEVGIQYAANGYDSQALAKRARVRDKINTAQEAVSEDPHFALVPGKTEGQETLLKATHTLLDEKLSADDLSADG